MIDLRELEDIRVRLVNISYVAKKEKIDRKIQILINGMIQAINSIVRLINVNARKEKIKQLTDQTEEK